MLLEKYSDRIKKVVAPLADSEFLVSVDLIRERGQKNRKILLVGNGGSAAICSHLAVDFTKAAGIRAINFSDPSLLTCFANDYGYESAYAEMIRVYGDSGDLLIAISSSGNSLNIVNAVREAKRLGMSIITLSGFDENNLLRNLGNVNFHLNSSEYNVVENGHEQILLALCDCIRLGEAEFRDWVDA